MARACSECIAKRSGRQPRIAKEALAQRMIQQSSPLMRSRCGIDSVRYPVASCTVACNREASGVARRPLRCSRRVGWGRSGAWNEQPEAAPLGERTYYRRTHLAVRFSTPEIKNKTRSLRSKVFLECGRGVIPAPLLVVHSEEAPRC